MFNWLVRLFTKKHKAKLELIVGPEIIIKLRAQIYPDKSDTQSLILDTIVQPVSPLADYLGYKEPKIVDWLLEENGFKISLFNKLFPNQKNIQYFTTVQEPFTCNGEKPGDIDIIAYSKIGEAIAFECKIVKVTAQPDNTIRINKVEKLKEGALQTNDYLKFGFSQVYFLIIILDDGRNYDKPNFIFNYTSEADLLEVYNGSWKECLNENIGIIYCSLEQTRNLNVDINNIISLDVRRKAIAKIQNIEVTEKIRSLS